MNILKGIAAVLAGIIFVVITHAGTDFVFRALGIFTPATQRFDTSWMLITAIIYRSLFSIAGGYITAIIAPPPKMTYVIILAAIGTVVSILGIFVAASYDLGPVWYPVALAVLAFPCVWYGGKLRSESSQARDE